MKKVLLIVLAIVAVLISASVIEGFIPEAMPAKPKAAVVIPEPKLVEASEVELEINKFRAERGLYALTDNPVLDKAAQIRAETMCAENDWSHDKAWQVLDQYYTYSLASENLHYNWLQDGQAAKAVDGWAHSPGHLKTMLADHTELGIGVKYCPGYQNNPTAVLITSYYGVPR